MYGTPKVHKPVINSCPKCNPILLAIKTHPCKLAKFFVPILSPLRVDGFLEHDSFSFPDDVSSFCPNTSITRIDVESIFTNISLNKIIGICIDDLFCHPKTIHELDHDNMRELLILAACDSCFTVDQVMSRQIDSVAISFPLVQFLANTFLLHFHKQYLSECSCNILLKVLKRCVDDIFVMFVSQLMFINKIL